MPDPHTLREALAIQMLGEIDTLVARVENIPQHIQTVEIQLQASTAALLKASDEYRLAVTSFTEQAKSELIDHLRQKSAHSIAKTVEEQRAIMQDIAISVFQNQIHARTDQLTQLLHQVTSQSRHPLWRRLIENSVVALAAAVIAVMLTALR